MADFEHLGGILRKPAGEAEPPQDDPLAEVKANNARLRADVQPGGPLADVAQAHQLLKAGEEFVAACIAEEKEQERQTIAALDWFATELSKASEGEVSIEEARAALYRLTTCQDNPEEAYLAAYRLGDLIRQWRSRNLPPEKVM